MPDVYLGRINRWIEKLFNIKGGPTLLDVNPSIHIVNVMGDNVEERTLASWQRFGSAGNTSAVAAQTSAFQIRNPSGSNVIAVIEKISVTTFTVTTRTTLSLGLGVNQADFGTLITPQRLDSRQLPGSVMVVSVAGGAGALNGVLVVGINNGQSYDLIVSDDQEFVLLPGDALRIIDNTVNEAFTASAFWRERALESSELT